MSDLREALRKDIMQNGADDGKTALHIAAENGHVAVVETLLKNGFNINDKTTNLGATALYIAAEYGHVAVVETLLKYGANRRAKTKLGDTALHIAESNGHHTIVKLIRYDLHGEIMKNETDNHAFIETLLNNGANIHNKDKWGCTPLHIAAMRGHLGIFETLLKYGANIHDKSNHGSTPLHNAAYNGNIAVVETLLKNGANIHAKDNDGYTALHDAAENGHVAVVETLLKNGAKIHDKTNQGALYVAERKGHYAIVKIINHALRMKRLRSYAKVVGRFMVIYNNVLEARYVPGGSGYVECKAEFNQCISSAKNSW